MFVAAYFIDGNPPEVAIKEPPADATRCTLEYLNEGGANFVFKIIVAENEDRSCGARGKLLRLRKNLPHIPQTTDILDAYRRNFKDLFSAEHLLESELVRLDENLPVALGLALRTITRPLHRAQDSLPSDERHGLLVTDMTPKPGHVSLQLKPKWLAQSPSAPANAKRCRTCALRAHRASRRIRTATDAQECCPLDLVSEDVEDRKRAARLVTADLALQDYLVDRAPPLLQTLRRHQRELDPGGVFSASDTASTFKLCKAMTLRDCTLFVNRSDSGIEARLGDLDLKQPEKMSKWKRVEQILIDDGWYANAEDGSIWVQETTCQLSRL